MIYFEQWLIILIYAAAFGGYIHDFRHNEKQGKHRSIQLSGIASGLHFLYLIHLALVLGHLPVTSVFETLTTCAWLFGIVYLGLEWRLKEQSLGMFILPIILVLQIISNAFIDLNRELPSLLLQELLFEIHVVVLLLSYSAFAISFIASMLYLLLSREIHKKSPGLFYRRLPSLAFFDSLSSRAVNIGLIFLTAGIALGIHDAIKLADQFFTWDAKFLAAGLTWLIYFFHVFGRHAIGWQGKRAAVVSLIGFGSLMFSFLIVSLGLSEVHKFQ